MLACASSAAADGAWMPRTSSKLVRSRPRSAASARLFVQRRRAVAVLQTALGCGGGERAPGSDALYVFDSVAAGLLAALDAKAALDKFVAQALVDVAATGFGIAAGELVAAPGATTGACVAVAARLCQVSCA